MAAVEPRPQDLLGPLEAVCMESLWRRTAASVADVLEDVHAEYDEDLAYTTVMTVMSRLYEKGFLVREQVGRGYRYEPVYGREELVDLLGGREVDELVERYGSVALAHFADALRRTDPALLAEIEHFTLEDDRA